MATNSAVPKNNPDPTVITILDDAQCPPVIKEFFSCLCVDIEKNRWTSKCRICSISITDTHKTTSNFLKHLKNKHQSNFDEWKINQDQCTKDKNQPKINNLFSPDSEKCKCFLVLKNLLITFTPIIDRRIKMI